MLALILASALFCPVAPSSALAAFPGTDAAAQLADDKALKALDAWLRLYRAGKIDYLSEKNIAKDSIAMKFGLTPKNGLGDPHWKGDLEVIAEAVHKLDSAAAAEALVELASIGIDQFKYTPEMAAYDVRKVGERWAAKLTSAEAKDALAKAARGELKGDKARAAALQCAGVKCLGMVKDPAFRLVLEEALADPDEIVRVTAAEMLGVLGEDTGALALIAALERDQVDAVLVAAAQSLRTLYSKHVPKAAPIQSTPPKAKPAEAGETKEGEKPAGGSAEKPADPAAPAAPAAAATPPAEATPAELPESVRLAVRAAVRGLGRTTWRGDMALVRLLDEFRSLEAVPALIGVLERFHAHPEDVKSGKLSGLLLYQSHELLVSMTGAVFPADQPEKWRAFWDAEKDKIAVTQKRDASAAGPAKTVASGFCGIPVMGTRVVFVLDLSGSMDFNMDEVEASGKKKLSKRIDFAKRELCRAIDTISPSAQFNLITFNGRDKAESWKKDLMPATPKNREDFKKYVETCRADGGTNLWAGLEEALKIKSLVYGNRYTTTIDELFVVSDGAPSVGEVQDSVEILRLVVECNKFACVRINTIYISSQTPPEHQRNEEKLSMRPQELMRRMAEGNGGKFREL
jgi:hypothetical protein